MTDGNEREHETKHELTEDDEQIIQNLTMTSRWFSISVGHACSSFGITGPDDNLELLDHLTGSPRGDVLPGSRPRRTTEEDAIQNLDPKQKDKQKES
jgi:hypothetical protein